MYILYSLCKRVKNLLSVSIFYTFGKETLCHYNCPKFVRNVVLLLDI